MNWTKGDDGTPQRIEIDLYDPESKTSATNMRTTETAAAASGTAAAAGDNDERE